MAFSEGKPDRDSSHESSCGSRYTALRRSTGSTVKLWIAFVATMLWHWEHRTLIVGTFNSRAFCEPCGVWQARQPSPFTAACS